MNEPLLTSKLMYQLDKYRFQSRNMKRGHHKGGRRSTKQGTSLEFSDYRIYQPGDDLRQIDWNVFARTNKHYIKRFLDEKELLVTVYLDCTKSMSLIPEKWQFAKRLTAAIGYMSLSADDRVGIFPIGSTSHPFGYKKGKAFSNRIVHYVDNISSSESESTFSDSVPSFIQPKSSVSILISDLLEPIELLEKALKKLQAYKQELYVIQLLGHEEINPHYHGDLELLDSETGDRVNVSMNRIVKVRYGERIANHLETLEKFCHGRGIGFLSCQTKDSLEDVLFNRMPSKGWV